MYIHVHVARAVYMYCSHWQLSISNYTNNKGVSSACTGVTTCHYLSPCWCNNLPLPQPVLVQHLDPTSLCWCNSLPLTQPACAGVTAGTYLSRWPEHGEEHWQQEQSVECSQQQQQRQHHEKIPATHSMIVTSQLYVICQTTDWTKLALFYM